MDVVENRINKKDNDKKGEYATKKLMNLKVQNCFFQTIDRKVLKMIFSKNTSKDVRDSMNKKFSE